MFVQRLKTSVFFVGILLTGITACVHDNEADLLAENQNSDTLTTDFVSFKEDVLPIIQENCTTCHYSPGTSGGGNTIEDYGTVKSKIDNGLLIPNINHKDGYVAMPYGLPKLAQTDIDIIEKWVEEGLKNN